MGRAGGPRGGGSEVSAEPTATEQPDIDLPDYDALHALWPQGKRYGEHGTWFEYVGRTLPMRNGLKALRVSRGPRGRVRLTSGGVRCRSTVSGEIQAR